MAWLLFGAKPFHDPMLTHPELKFGEQFSVNFEYKYKYFNEENAIENDNMLKLWA